MASGSYRQVDVQCPFYREDDGQRNITCEGFGDATSLSQHYRYKRRYKRQYVKQMEVFCGRHYGNCEVFRTLMETKYAD